MDAEKVEKVCKGLECCKKHDCDLCPYDFAVCWNDTMFEKLSSDALSVIRELKAENERMNELLKEQEQLKIALSEGQKQVQSLLSSGRELEETINILKGEIERLKQEKADAVKRIERCRQNCISGEKDCDSAYNKSGKVWYRAKADAYKQALDIINSPSI